jgi:YfiH family protein
MISAPLIPTPLIAEKFAPPHGFFTRIGGVSTGAYASLNCGLNGADAPDHVATNRARAARAISADPAALSGLVQVHGNRAIAITHPIDPSHRPQADALVTATPGLALGIITADCAPVLFSAEAGRIVGAAHAGWRGALLGVLDATIDAMRQLGASTIDAVIGPCIHQASYEVGADLHEAVCSHNPSDRQFFRAAQKPDHWQFDLPGYCAARLARAGVATAILSADTYADPARFFSHRRRTHEASGPGGHQISIIRTAS